MMKARALNTSRPLIHVYLYMDVLACGKKMKGNHWELFPDCARMEITCPRCIMSADFLPADTGKEEE